MTKRIFNVVVIIILFLMVGCANVSTAKGVELEGATQLGTKAIYNKDNNTTEEEFSQSVKGGTLSEDTLIYNLKSVSVFIASRNHDYSGIASLSRTYISVKLESNANIGTDTVKRESLRSKKITDFGKVIKINYLNYNPIVISKTKLAVKVKFAGFDTDKILEKEATLDFVRTDEDANYLTSELDLDNQSDLMLIFKAEIESTAN